MREPGSLQHAFDAWAEIIPSLEGAQKILLGFDFDGTLSPIVDDPADASIPEGIQLILRDLSSLENTTIAILSGRSLSDLRDRAKLKHIALAGDHGLKIQHPNGEEYRPKASITPQDVRALTKRVEADASRLTGIQLEPKEFSLTVHYRRAPSGTGEKLHGILSKATEGTPFRLRAGRMCWELNPRVGWNKGQAFRWIREHCLGKETDAFELYIGDDQTDEDIFQLIEANGYPILVVSSEKTGSTHARLRLNSQSDVAVFLEKVRDYLTNKRSVQPR